MTNNLKQTKYNKKQFSIRLLILKFYQGKKDAWLVIDVLTLLVQIFLYFATTTIIWMTYHYRDTVRS